jgi:transcriptional regulator with XRE-family HTH domain
MGYSNFTEEQISEYILNAQEMGIGPAMRYLGYPKSYHTAKKWFVERNIEMPTLDTLAKMAGDLKVFYSDKEKIIAAQAIIDRSVEALYQDTLIPDDINKLSTAIHKAIQTINLIEGKSTIINEQRNKDNNDLAIIDLLNEAKARNEYIKENMKGLTNDV